jgi:hypothetical protein
LNEPSAPAAATPVAPVAPAKPANAAVGSWLQTGSSNQRGGLEGTFVATPPASASTKFKTQYQFLELFLKKRHTVSTVFGQSLEALYKATGSPIPLVVLQCIDYLTVNGVVQGIFRQSAMVTETQALKQAFHDPHSRVDIAALITEPHAAAVTLKQFFSELPEPIFPFDQYEPLSHAYNLTGEARFAAFRQLLAALPSYNKPVLKLLFEFLSSFADAHSTVTLMNPDNLGIVFGPNLIRPRVLTPQIAIDRYDSKITAFLILHYHELFSTLDLSQIMGRAGMTRSGTNAPLPAPVPSQSAAPAPTPASNSVPASSTISAKPATPPHSGPLATPSAPVDAVAPMSLGGGGGGGAAAAPEKREKKAMNIARRLSVGILARGSASAAATPGAHAAAAPPAAPGAAAGLPPGLGRQASLDVNAIAHAPLPAPITPSAAPISGVPLPRRATVLWDWLAAGPTEVSCVANEVVLLLDNPDGSVTGEWQYIKTNAGLEGYIARNYLQEIQQTGVSVPAAAILGRGRGRGKK